MRFTSLGMAARATASVRLGERTTPAGAVRADVGTRRPQHLVRASRIRVKIDRALCCEAELRAGGDRSWFAPRNRKSQPYCSRCWSSNRFTIFDFHSWLEFSMPSVATTTSTVLRRACSGIAARRAPNSLTPMPIASSSAVIPRGMAGGSDTQLVPLVSRNACASFEGELHGCCFPAIRPLSEAGAFMA